MTLSRAPKVNVLSLGPKLDDPIIAVPVINTFWLSLLTNEAVDANDELTTFCIEDVAVGIATPLLFPTQVKPCCMFGTSL